MKVAAVLPCFNSKNHVMGVLSAIGPEFDLVFVIDDACPQGTGRHVQEYCHDSRVQIVFHERNLGVGGAVLTGYRKALEAECDIIVKIDSDGQMDPSLAPQFIQPLRRGMADYVKGNRFFNPDDLREMPVGRVFGNLGLSFLTKLSTGYWDIFDPTNGYTAIHRVALMRLPMDKISQRFFFETDMLFRLNLANAVVLDMPMRAKYAGEASNLSPIKSLFDFSWRHLRILLKRIIYKYFLRDFSMGSLCLLFSFPLMAFGAGFGIYDWFASAKMQTPTPTGTILLEMTTLLLGFQLLFVFCANDQNSTPRIPLQTILGK